MDAQIGSVVSGSHHLLHLLRRLIPFIPKEDIAVVVGTIVKVEVNPPIFFSQGSCHLGLRSIFNCHEAAHVISYDTSHWMV